MAGKLKILALPGDVNTARTPHQFPTPSPHLERLEVGEPSHLYFFSLSPKSHGLRMDLFVIDRQTAQSNTNLHSKKTLEKVYLLLNTCAIFRGDLQGTKTD